MGDQKTKDHYSKELQAFAAEYLRLDFEKGEIYWKKSRGGKIAGSRAGCVWADPRKGHGNKQYRVIGINGELYREHRLLFCFFYKSSFEGLEIDHVNQNSLDNRIENLRWATRATNGKNVKKPNTNSSGFVGVSWDKKAQKWEARIMVEGKSKHLGYFTNQEDAIAAREAANDKYQFHPHHGKTAAEIERMSLEKATATAPIAVNPFSALPLFANV